MDESDISPAMIARARVAFDKWVARVFLGDGAWPKDEAIESLLCSIILAAHGQGAEARLRKAGYVRDGISPRAAARVRGLDAVEGKRRDAIVLAGDQGVATPAAVPLEMPSDEKARSLKGREVEDWEVLRTYDLQFLQGAEFRRLLTLAHTQGLLGAILQACEIPDRITWLDSGLPTAEDVRGILK